MPPQTQSASRQSQIVSLLDIYICFTKKKIYTSNPRANKSKTSILVKTYTRSSAAYVGRGAGAVMHAYSSTGYRMSCQDGMWTGIKLRARPGRGDMMMVKNGLFWHDALSTHLMLANVSLKFSALGTLARTAYTIHAQDFNPKRTRYTHTIADDSCKYSLHCSYRHAIQPPCPPQFYRLC
jgi:hypothetical protein